MIHFQETNFQFANTYRHGHPQRQSNGRRYSRCGINLFRGNSQSRLFQLANCSIDSNISLRHSANVLNILTDINFDSSKQDDEVKKKNKKQSKPEANFFLNGFESSLQIAEASKLSVNVELLTFAITMLHSGI